MTRVIRIHSKASHRLNMKLSIHFGNFYQVFLAQNCNADVTIRIRIRITVYFTQVEEVKITIICKFCVGRS